MICIHCGEKIPYGETTCPLCGEQTEFEERYHYIPSPAPIHDISYADTEDDKTGDKTGKRPSVEDDLSDKDTVNQRAEDGINPGVRRVSRPVAFLLCVVLLLTVLLFLSVDANCRLRNGTSPGMSTISPDTDINLPEELPENKEPEEFGAPEAEGQKADEQVPDEQAADSQGERAQRGYWLDFDLNLPKEVPQEEKNGPERVIYEPGMTAPLPDIDISGYSFVGWGTAPVELGSVIAPGKKIPLLTEDTVLYGIWHKDEENRIPEEYKNI